jgi:UDP-N-acetyl-D-mannosaminuronate dehydrogenase
VGWQIARHQLDDARNSPAQRIIEVLLDLGAEVEYHAACVSGFEIGGALHREGMALRPTRLEAGQNRERLCLEKPDLEVHSLVQT